MSNKTISINPNLFSIKGTKSKKNREKKEKMLITPLISPNVLKNKLLKRIKEHKQRETENLDNNKKKLPQAEIDTESTPNINYKKDIDIASDAFSDEFTNSINYLNILSQQKKINDEKNNYEIQKNKRKDELNRATLKNYNSVNAQPYVNIDLPEELQININTEQFKSGGQTISLNPYIQDTVPYGILKGGLKPTYRDWSRTQRNNIVTNPNAALTIQGTEISKEKLEREHRLNNLREKLQQKQLEETMQKNEDVMMNQNLIQKPISESIVPVITNIIETLPLTQVANSVSANSNSLPHINVEDMKVIATKNIIKKTIKRKYTLGKSAIKKTVAVLIKDRGTRKLVLNAQKDLKTKPINDVKVYLREHNLIKVGSTAPNDVIRKLYESAMLAGEITNSNTETLLHNFSKDDKEL